MTTQHCSLPLQGLDPLLVAPMKVGRGRMLSLYAGPCAEEVLTHCSYPKRHEQSIPEGRSTGDSVDYQAR
jgi:hypothetical protein